MFWEIDVRTWMDYKLFNFLFGFGGHYSSMLLVLMSVEKCFALYFPLKIQKNLYFEEPKWATGVVGFVLAGYNSVYFFVVESSILKSSGCHTCAYTGGYREILFAIDSILYSFEPFTLMFTANFAIGLIFIRVYCNQNYSSESTNQVLAKSVSRRTLMMVTVSVIFLLVKEQKFVFYYF